MTDLTDTDPDSAREVSPAAGATPERPQGAAPAAAQQAPRPRRSFTMPVLLAVAGLVVLLVAVLVDQPLSIGSALGVLLLLSAAVRIEIARRI